MILYLALPNVIKPDSPICANYRHLAFVTKLAHSSKKQTVNIQNQYLA